MDAERARQTVGRSSTVGATDSLDQVLADATVEAVAIATPAGTHLDVAMACFAAGKHVLIEKPLAPSVEEAKLLVDAAADRGLTLMCDHTYCYTPSVRAIRDLVARGELGDVQYFDSVRINLGLVQPDVDVFWDLAPHDLSILDFVLPEGCEPVAVAAQGADPIGAGKVCVGYLTLPLRGGAIAHVHVNWLSPTKIRTTIIGGSRRMVVWDDLNPSQRVSIYDKGVDRIEHPDDDSETRRQALISYRSGAMTAPALGEGEALQGVVGELVASIREQRTPLTDGASGLRVLQMLEAASRSLAQDGATVPLEDYH
jgi:predicted dehydrogenase